MSSRTLVCFYINHNDKIEWDKSTHASIRCCVKTHRRKENNISNRVSTTANVSPKQRSPPPPQFIFYRDNWWNLLLYVDGIISHTEAKQFCGRWNNMAEKNSARDCFTQGIKLYNTTYQYQWTSVIIVDVREHYKENKDTNTHSFSSQPNSKKTTATFFSHKKTRRTKRFISNFEREVLEWVKKDNNNLNNLSQPTLRLISDLMYFEKKK